MTEKFESQAGIPEDTVLDEYPMPDPSVSPTALKELDGGRKDLLPLSVDRACELVEEMSVYAALPESIPDMPLSRWDIQQYPPDTLFALPKKEWEKSMGFHIALNERTGRQTQRERAFLRHTGDCFAVYQFRTGTDVSRPGYVTLESARKSGLTPRQSGYDIVYTASLTGSDNISRVEKQFREHPPVDFHHRNVRAGDIIAVKKDGKLKAWYLDQIAFSELPGLFGNVPLYRTGEQGERLPLYDEIPVYRQTGQYAQEHGELNAYSASFRANTACRDAVDKAVAEHYHDWRLDTDAAVRQVADEFGYERMLYVLAFSIRHKSWDGRISRENIRWAESISIIPDISSGGGNDRSVRFLVDKTHPGLLDIFTKAARRDYERSRPLSAEEITGEAERILTGMKALEGPNGPDKQSFVIPFSAEFVFRANKGDYIMLSSMMPFKSFAVAPVRDFSSGGLCAQIAGNESRGPGRQLKEPTFKPRRSVKRREASAR